jgi:hypothetical protein
MMPRWEEFLNYVWSEEGLKDPALDNLRGVMARTFLMFAEHEVSTLPRTEQAALTETARRASEEPFRKWLLAQPV